MVAGHLQIKKGNYYMVLNLHDEQGARKSKWLPTGIPVSGKKSQKQAEELLWETRHSYKDTVIRIMDAGAAHMTGNMLFADYMADWLGVIKNSVEEVTYAGYESVVKRRIAPYFKKRGVTLSGLTALDIEGFYEYCINKLSLKGSTVQHFHANIHKALKYAVRHDLIGDNPMNKVDRPKSLPYTGSFYSIAEVETLFQMVKGDPVEFPVLMASFYGLRLCRANERVLQHLAWHPAQPLSTAAQERTDKGNINPKPGNRVFSMAHHYKTTIFGKSNGTTESEIWHTGFRKTRYRDPQMTRLVTSIILAMMYSNTSSALLHRF